MLRLHSDEHMRVLLDNDNHIYFSLAGDMDEFWMQPQDILDIADKLRQHLKPPVLLGDGFIVREENA